MYKINQYNNMYESVVQPYGQHTYRKLSLIYESVVQILYYDYITYICIRG